ncbi:hypothetical protein HKX48_004268 [Thoreauomyces humboldtii]|nr:hypothetical protein HKX48_004268 [Thoreauomyces humboldtii]
MSSNLPRPGTVTPPSPRCNPLASPHTRIPVPTQPASSATVDRITENLASLALSVDKKRGKELVPPPIPPRPAGRPPRHASPAAEREAGRTHLKDEGPPSAATRRKLELSNVYFHDFYYDLLTYLDHRKQRLQSFRNEHQNAGEEEQQRAWKRYCGKERVVLRKRRTRTRLASFNILTQVGQGGYGQVFLARKNDTKELCALKKMSKKQLHKLGEIDHILTERDILTRTSTPWLVKLLYAFQDTDHVYLAMEYVPGGDMRTLLNNSGVLREAHARFYVAEMVVAVAELHQLGYIHRDLKPENFLVDATGHLKLTDFGLSRGRLSTAMVERMEKRLSVASKVQPTPRSTAERRNIHRSIRREDMLAYSLVGSPDYMAPEVLNGKQEGYGLAADYWSIGCILFECLAGFPPFTAATTDEVWVNVYNWAVVLERPEYTGADVEFNLSDTAWDLITSFLINSASRLQTLQAIQVHPFFVDHPFTRLRSATPLVRPPFVPALKEPTDTAYFDDFTDEADMKMYKEVQERMRDVEGKSGDGPLGKEVRDQFVGFTFRHGGYEGPEAAELYTGSTML